MSLQDGYPVYHYSVHFCRQRNGIHQELSSSPKITQDLAKTELKSRTDWGLKKYADRLRDYRKTVHNRPAMVNLDGSHRESHILFPSYATQRVLVNWHGMGEVTGWEHLAGFCRHWPWGAKKNRDIRTPSETELSNTSMLGSCFHSPVPEEKQRTTLGDWKKKKSSTTVFFLRVFMTGRKSFC